MKKFKTSIVLFVGLILAPLCLWSQFNFQEVATVGDNLAIYRPYYKTFSTYENRVLIKEAAGFSIYTINEDGDLNLESIISKSSIQHADMYGDYAVISTYANLETNQDESKVFVYDISDLANPQIVHEQVASISDIAVTTDYYCFNIEFEAQIYSLNTFELTSQNDDYTLLNRIIGSERLKLRSSHGAGPLCIADIDENGALETPEYISLGNPQVVNDLIISMDNSTIKILSTDNYDLISIISFDEVLISLSPTFYMYGDRIACLFESDDDNYRAKLKLYDISDLENIITEDDYYMFEKSEYDEILIDDSFGYGYFFNLLVDEDGLYRVDLSSDVVSHEKIMSSPVPSDIVLKNNKIYYNFKENSYQTKIYDISDYNNIQDITDSEPHGIRFYFGEELERYVCYSHVDQALKMYQLNLTGSYDLVNTIDVSEHDPTNYNIKVLDWSNERLIYSVHNHAYYLQIDGDTIAGSWNITYTTDSIRVNWHIFDNYLYSVLSAGYIRVYQFDDENYEQLDTYQWDVSNFDFAGSYLDSGLLAVEDYNSDKTHIFDLNEDSEDLSVECDLNEVFLSSAVKQYNDYYIYAGSDEDIAGYIPNSAGLERDQYLCIFKKVEDEFIKVGNIYNADKISTFAVKPVSDTAFDLVVPTTSDIKIYSCQTTPNGDFEITPVTMNSSCYPNPFNPETTISYDLPLTGEVELAIFNLKGQKVKTLVKDSQKAGNHQVVWNGTDAKGNKVASGTYLYKVKTKSNEITHKIMMIK